MLLVDDSCNKGGAFKRAVGLLPKGVKVTRLAVFGPYQVDPESVCDMWFETVHGPRIFAWNWVKHIRLPRWGFDMPECVQRYGVDDPRCSAPRAAKLSILVWSFSSRLRTAFHF